MIIRTWYLSPVDLGFSAVQLKLRLMCRLEHYADHLRFYDCELYAV